MKRHIVVVVLIVFSLAAFMTGCDQIKQIFGIGAPQPGPVGPAPGTSPSGPGGQPGVPGSIIPGMSPPRILNSCVITDFKLGKMKEDESGNLFVYEQTPTIQYIPGTYFGISFGYTSNTGGTITYYEEEFFPAPPQNWTLWEGSEGSYKTFPAENRAVYTTTLTPDSDIFTSYWGFNPSGDPTGQWRWDIYFNNEYYTTVVFDIVPATY